MLSNDFVVVGGIREDQESGVQENSAMVLQGDCTRLSEVRLQDRVHQAEVVEQ